MTSPRARLTALLGADDKLTVIIEPRTGHKANPDALAAARQWLAAQLRPGPAW